MVFTSPKEAAEFVEVVADVKKIHSFEVLEWCSTTGNQYNNCGAGFQPAHVN